MGAGGEQIEPANAGRRAWVEDREFETELLERLASGERGEALRDLAERYAPRLYDLGLSLLGSPVLAERSAVETIDAVASRAGELDPQTASPREFVYDVARGRIAALTEAEDEGGSGADPPADERFESVVADVEFRAAVAGLGDEGRGVLEGVLGEGLSRAEVGERLGLTVGIVEVRLRTALRAVRDELDARGVAADGRR